MLTYILFHGLLTFGTLWFLFHDKTTAKSHWVGLLVAGCLAIAVAFMAYVIFGWLLPIGLTIVAFSILKLINPQGKGALAVIFFRWIVVLYLWHTFRGQLRPLNPARRARDDHIFS